MAGEGLLCEVSMEVSEADLARASANCWSSILAVSLAEALMASSSVTWVDNLNKDCVYERGR